MSEKKPMNPMAMKLGAVEGRIKAAESLFFTAIFEGDAEAMQAQRDTLHALLDERLDVMAGMLTLSVRGEL